MALDFTVDVNKLMRQQEQKKKTGMSMQNTVNNALNMATQQPQQPPKQPAKQTGWGVNAQ